MLHELHAQGVSISAIARQTGLDRLLHHAIVIEIEGHSYRLREHANLVPDSLKGQLLDRVEKPKRQPGRPRQRQPTGMD